MVAQFLQAGQTMAVNTIFTYGITISVLLSVLSVAIIVGLNEQIIGYFTPYLAEEAMYYFQYAGSFGSVLSYFSSSMRPYYRVENRGALEIYMDVCATAIKLTLLMTLLQLNSADVTLFADNQMQIVVIAELVSQSFAFLLSISALIPSISKISGLHIYSKFSLALFNPLRFKVMLQIFKNIPSYYLYQARWGIAAVIMYATLIANESGSDFQKFTIIYAYFMMRIGRLAASFLYVSEPITLALGSINISVKRFDRVYRLVIQSLIIVFALSSSFSFIIFVCCPIFAERLLLAENGALLTQYTHE